MHEANEMCMKSDTDPDDMYMVRWGKMPPRWGKMSVEQSHPPYLAK